MPGPLRSIQRFHVIADHLALGLKPVISGCYICGKGGKKLFHPDELTLHRSSVKGCILCNYCHRPVCSEHISPIQIPKLLRIRPQHFCTSCTENLIGEKK